MSPVLVKSFYEGNQWLSLKGTEGSLRGAGVLAAGTRTRTWPGLLLIHGEVSVSPFPGASSCPTSAQ